MKNIEECFVSKYYIPCLAFNPAHMKQVHKRVPKYLLTTCIDKLKENLLFDLKPLDKTTQVFFEPYQNNNFDAICIKIVTYNYQIKKDGLSLLGKCIKKYNEKVDKNKIQVILFYECIINEIDSIVLGKHSNTFYIPFSIFYTTLGDKPLSIEIPSCLWCEYLDSIAHTIRPQLEKIFEDLLKEKGILIKKYVVTIVSYKGKKYLKFVIEPFIDNLDDYTLFFSIPQMIQSNCTFETIVELPLMEKTMTNDGEVIEDTLTGKLKFNLLLSKGKGIMPIWFEKIEPYSSYHLIERKRI